MNQILTKQQRLELLVCHKANKDRVSCDRIKAILMKDNGWTYEKIAEALLITPETVSNHIEQYLADNKLTKTSGGSAPKLTLKQTADFIKSLENKCYANVQEIIVLCQTMFGITYAKTGMIDWLHRNDFDYVEPVKVLPNRNKKSQEEFISQYQKLKEKVEASEENEVLLHMDSVHPTMNLKTSSGWMRKSSPLKLEVRGSSTRVNLVGVLNLAEMSVLTANYKTIDSDNIILFLSNIRQFYGEKTINLVLDNGRYHKTKEVREFCEENNIILHFLPPYSPNLNPIERVWKVMNQMVRNNVVFEKPKIFRSKLNEFFAKTWDNISDTLYSKINDNFHILA